ncbi:MAG: hypothetical protein AB1546_08890 [bacterium]
MIFRKKFSAILISSVLFAGLLSNSLPAQETGTLYVIFRYISGPGSDYSFNAGSYDVKFTGLTGKGDVIVHLERDTSKITVDPEDALTAEISPLAALDDRSIKIKGLPTATPLKISLSAYNTTFTTYDPKYILYNKEISVEVLPDEAEKITVVQLPADLKSDPIIGEEPKTKPQEGEQPAPSEEQPKEPPRPPEPPDTGPKPVDVPPPPPPKDTTPAAENEKGFDLTALKTLPWEKFPVPSATAELKAGNIVLDGSKSVSKSAAKLKYHWSQTAGPLLKKNVCDTAKCELPTTASGKYAFRLDVTEDKLTNSQTVEINVPGAAPISNKGDLKSALLTEYDLSTPWNNIVSISHDHILTYTISSPSIRLLKIDNKKKGKETVKELLVMNLVGLGITQVTSVVTNGNKLYVAGKATEGEQDEGATGENVEKSIVCIFDISDTIAPVLIGKIDFAKGELVKKLKILSDKLYVIYSSGDKGMSVYNVSNPSSPVEAASMKTEKTANAEIVEGDQFYIEYGKMGSFKLYDLSDLTAPKIEGKGGLLRLFASWRSAKDGFFAALPFYEKKSPVFEIYKAGGKPDNPEMDMVGEYISKFGDPADIYESTSKTQFIVDGNIAYIAHDVEKDGTKYYLELVDLSDPAKPSLIGYFQTPDQITSIAVNGSLVYVCAKNKLYVFLMYRA